jgi:hypothetical protein
MTPNVRIRLSLPSWGALPFLGLVLLAGYPATAGDRIWRLGRRHEAATPVQVYQAPADGTLGYGPPGLHPGFQGFGLGYHPGYGYGGDALGVGAFGGYPFYGGPGYPHPAPRLNRGCGINPFPHYGGPGHPTPSHPNVFGPVGPLIVDRPVVTVLSEPGEAHPDSAFGCFTGTLPYSEHYFAPFAAAAASSGSGGRMGSPQPTPVPDSDSPED